MSKGESRKNFLNKKSQVDDNFLSEIEQSPIGLLETPSIGLNINAKLSEAEEFSLQQLLKEYQYEDKDSSVFSDDFKKLKLLTIEIRSITAQAVILHGERIKQAQKILGVYKEGAFSRWLMQTYGNRSTPYSYLHFYELHLEINPSLKKQLDLMPKKAAYRLATRSGKLEVKEEIVEKFANQKQSKILQIIEKAFPVSPQDGRRRKNDDVYQNILDEIEALEEKLFENKDSLSKEARSRIGDIVERLQQIIKIN